MKKFLEVGETIIAEVPTWIPSGGLYNLAGSRVATVTSQASAADLPEVMTAQISRKWAMLATKAIFASGGKIEAIKFIRSLGNYGLKEAKDIVEDICEG